MATEKTTTPAPEPAPAAQVEAPKKKSNATLIVILVLVFLFVVMPIIGIVGFSFFVKSKVKDATKNGITIGTGEDSVTLSASEDQKWPSTIPSNIPEFKAGKIQSSGRIDRSWTLTIAEVKASDVTTYKNTLTNNGWTISTESDLGGLVSFTAEKGDWQISPMYNSAENALVLGISEYKEAN